jgi:hypothetical protein
MLTFLPLPSSARNPLVHGAPRLTPSEATPHARFQRPCGVGDGAAQEYLPWRVMGSSVWSLAALLLWLDGVGSAPPGPGTSTSRSLPELRDQARQVLLGSCGRCHDGTRPTAKPAALRIFDLHQREWAAGMSNEQMNHMSSRFEGFGMPIPDRARVQAYIDAEIARRAERQASSGTVDPL